MALKARFKKKEINIKSADEKKVEYERKTSLQLLKGGSEFDAAKILDSSSRVVTGDDPLLEKKLNCYHKINEFYQSGSLNLFHLMKGILDIISHGIEAECGSLWILDSETNQVTCKVANGPGSETLKGVSLDNGQGIVGWTTKNSRSTIVYDASVDKRVNKDADKKSKFQTKSLIAAPLVYSGECIGCIEVINKKTNEGHFNDGDKFFLEDLATLAAMHVKTSRVLKEQDVVISRMETFSDIHEKFSSTMELQPLLDMVLDRAISLLGAQVGSVWLVEDNGEGVECYVAHGPTKDKVEGLKLKKGVGIIGDIVENVAPVIVEDCSKDPRFSKMMDDKINFQTKSMVAVPLAVKDEVIGAIQIINKKDDKNLFTADDLKLLHMFGATSSMYIKNARLFNAEKKAKELGALIDISKEITSTLDLDAVLYSVVNLSSQIIPYDEAQMGTLIPGKTDQFQLRAISGEEEVDESLEKVNKIKRIHNLFGKEEGEKLYIPNTSKFQWEDKEFLAAVKEYTEVFECRSFFIQKLQDDQGVVGVYSFEGAGENLIQEDKEELLSLLNTQVTVALRNAELYNTIPNAQIFKNFQNQIIARIQNIKDYSLQTWGKIAGALALASFFLMVVKIPHNINANVEILPKNYVSYAKSQGKVSKVLVVEGQQVSKGEVLVELNVEDQIIQQKQKLFQRQKAKTEMLKLRSEGNIADYKIKEAEYLSLSREIDLLNHKIKASKVVAEVDGIVISEELQNLVGMPVNYGQELVKLASLDSLFVQFEVPESDVTYVKSGQEVKFKVYGLPTQSFKDMELLSVSGEGRQILESDPAKYYFARAEVKVDKALGLKPGMTGRGKVFADWRSLWSQTVTKVYHFLVMEIFF